MPLIHRVAVVTGGARGIGREIALQLGRTGLRVAISYRTNQIGAQKVVDLLTSAGTSGLAVRTDATDPVQTKELTETVIQHFGRLDVLINNVGMFGWKTVKDSTPEEWREVIASNLDSVFYACRSVLPVMRRQRWGRIINIGAVDAERTFGQAKIAAYSAAKSGMVAFSRALALEEARYGITVNVVNPPAMDNKDLTVEEAERMKDARFPVGRPPTPQDVAEAVKFFASEGAAFVTGQVLNVCGGWML